MKLVPEEYSSKPISSVPDFQELVHKSRLPRSDEDLFSKKQEGARSLLAESKIPDDIKLQLYGSIMNIVNSHLIDIMNKPFSVKVIDDKKTKVIPEVNENKSDEKIEKTPIIEEKPNVVENLVNETVVSPPTKATYMPRALMERQQYIMNKLMDHPDMIRWDDDFRVTFYGNHFSPNSNIHALLHSVTSDIKDIVFPHGYSSFENVLKMMNIPPHVFSKRLHPMLSSPKPPEEFSTPNQTLTLSSWRDVASSPKVPQVAAPISRNLTQTKAVLPRTTKGSSTKVSPVVVTPVSAQKPPVSRQSTPGDYSRNVNDRRGSKGPNKPTGTQQQKRKE